MLKAYHHTKTAVAIALILVCVVPLALLWVAGVVAWNMTDWLRRN